VIWIIRELRFDSLSWPWTSTTAFSTGTRTAYTSGSLHSDFHSTSTRSEVHNHHFPLCTAHHVLPRAQHLRRRPMLTRPRVTKGYWRRHHWPALDHSQSHLPGKARVPHTHRLGPLRPPLYVHPAHRSRPIDSFLAAEAHERTVSVEKLNDLVKEQGRCLSFAPYSRPHCFL
jgi:hypothetical protein